LVRTVTWRIAGREPIRRWEVAGMHKEGAYQSNGRIGTVHGHGTSPNFLFCKGISKTGLDWSILKGDVRKVLLTLPDDHFNCIVTSPPYYWQRDYEDDDQIGLEPTIGDYVNIMADVMDQVYRVLAKDGLLFLNLGDTYYSRKGEPRGNDRKNWARRFGVRAVDKKGLGVQRKTSIGMPWRVAIEMISRKWILRSPIVWRRKAAQPEPTAKDRPWRTYEMVFMFSKRPVYYFSREALRGEEDVWVIPSHSRVTQKEMTAFFPEDLVKRCLNVGCIPGGRVLDPFAGTGTTLRAALASGRPAVGIDVSKRLCETMANSLRTL
jgi:DNA modification methylase